MFSAALDVPLLLLGQLLLSSLCLHLLHLNGVWLPTAHVQLVVAHAQCKDSLVDPEARRKEHKIGRLLVNGLDDELPVIEGNISDLTPGEANLGSQSVNRGNPLIHIH